MPRPVGPPTAAADTMVSAHTGTHSDGHVRVRLSVTTEMTPQHTVPTADDAAARGRPILTA
jgi:hypothetical protein